MLASLRLRLILSHLAVIFVAMGASAFLLLSLMERYLLQTVEDGLIAQGRLIAQVLIPNASVAGPGVGGQPSAYNALQQNSIRSFNLQSQSLQRTSQIAGIGESPAQLGAQLETRIQIVDAGGTILMDTRGQPGASLLANPLVAEGLRGNYARAVGVSEGESVAEGEAVATMRIVLPLMADGRVTGAIYLSQSLRDTTAVLQDVQSQLLISAGIALLVSALVGLVLSQAIARPVRQLTATAEAIARGKPLAEVAGPDPKPARPGDDLGRLRTAFFNMLSRLQAASRMQTDFVANVSHELRTPLTSLKGMVETLRDGAVDDPTVRDGFLATIEHETDRLTRLVNDLLLLSRADSHALALRREEVDLLQLARAAAGRLQQQAEARQVTVGIAADGEVALARADPDRIEQVLLNVLANAIQYSDPGGSVKVLVDAPAGGREVCLKVCDHGIGIPAEALARVGQRFYRVDRARARAEGGIGLGLAIARALVDAHGGRLWIESQEGQGTTVTISLPTH